ncbi:MAG: alpha-glucan family phosphorylase [Bacteroidales bacterium]|nr:alpha-glucan family phosphorylase [Bacteroidales bacterium]
MKTPSYLFETSWEVCNMIGGIYTVISSKADEMKMLLSDHYITIGPDVVKEAHETMYFVEDTSLLQEWRQKVAEELGLKVRVGRWKLPSSPIAILIDYTSLYPIKNDILAHFWEKFNLDSIQGQWDYIEPVLFGYAAGKVIESFVKWNVVDDEDVVAQFHEWMTGSGVLYLKENCQQVATVFTTHATYIGRAVSGNGLPLYSHLNTYNPQQMASRFNIVSQQSMESKAAQNADVFTTVSAITAKECEQFLDRKPDVLTINGINDQMINLSNTPNLFNSVREKSRGKVFEIIDALSGTDVPRDSMLVINSGRYEFKNKGIDLYIKALGFLNKCENLKRNIVAVIAVPGNIASPSRDLSKRLAGEMEIKGHTDYPTTHYIFDYQYDSVLNSLRENGLQNDAADKVKVIFIPAYLNGKDGIVNIPYGEFLYAFDLSVFPSYYEPWGYTPLESVAHSIPTLTSDVSGFGMFVKENMPENEAVNIIHRDEQNSDAAIEEISNAILRMASKNENEIVELRKEALKVASALRWKELVSNYLQAYDIAIEKLSGREYVKHTKKYSEILRNFDYKKQDQPTWKKIFVEPVYSDLLLKLNELAHNVWWCWNVEAIELFESVDPEAFEKLEQNPIALMKELTRKQIDTLEKDENFINKLNKVYDEFKSYMSVKPENDNKIAYFSMEYGLLKSLKIYSGGLGILAGDYLKQASDSNVNMFAIGLLYRYGYFNQELSVWGDQLSQYLPQKFSNLPIDPVRDDDGNWVTVSIAFPGRSVYAKTWKVSVGRIDLYLLDTDIEQNSPEDRAITGQLYGGDSEMRIKQEMFLGIGGIRLINALNIKPTIYHCNEGHAAFCGLERLGNYIAKHNLDFDVAKELVKTSTLFTTHTPVPAGHDAFEENLIRTYLPHFAGRMNISWEQFMNLGRMYKNNPNEKFSMSVLATNLSQEVNGVSKIHGRVSRDMFQQMWPGYFAEENHIGYVTNGVHLPTWADKRWQRLYENVMGTNYLDNQSDEAMWAKIQDVPNEEIWNIRKELKHNLIEFLKVKVVEDMQRRSESPRLIIETVDNLNENALIIGFARRFATYKRAHLLFTNLERLAEIVNDPKRPVLFLFAGKAHPNDKAGQDLIKNIIEVARRKEFAGKILFINNYDMEIGKLLTSSVDIWMNTPTRPLEASGTSGEKAAMNGTLNFSVLDGWWAEGYRQKAGWALKEERTYQDQRYQDDLDAETIYNTFENEIIPLYYTRNQQNVPEEWIQWMKNDLMQVAPNYTMKRMLDDYFERYYNKLIERTNWMRENRYQKAFEIVEWKRKIEANWDRIEVEAIKVPDPTVRPLTFGDEVIAEIMLKTPGLDRGDVGVEILFADKINDEIKELAFKSEMMLVDSGEGWAKYYIVIPIFKAGVFNYTFRIFPKNEMLPNRQDLPLVKWI